jgi:hypothetical protein
VCVAAFHPGDGTSHSDEEGITLIPSGHVKRIF